MRRRLSASQISALKVLMSAPQGWVYGREGWANGNCVTALVRSGLARLTYDGQLKTHITEDGRAAFGVGYRNVKEAK